VDARDASGLPDAGDDSGTCLAFASQAIFYGAPHLDGGQVSEEQTWAIGALESELGFLYCTGTLIHPRWVLTAAHCAIENSRLRMAAEGAPTVVTPLGQVFDHPTADLALIEVLSPGDLVAAGVRPLAIQTDPLDADLVGTQAILAGVGITEDGGRGDLNFVEELVSAVDDTFITVDGRGRTGACTGDSGGPLIVRTNAGVPEILGTLSEGSQNCLGTDLYVRVDALTQWIQDTQKTPPLEPCGS
jgi:hypothetical protein